MIGAFCFILVQWVATKYFPGINQRIISEMPGPNGIPLKLQDTNPIGMPTYSYRCSFVGRTDPVSYGFLGLSKTPPFWWYHLWIANLSTSDLKDVCISAKAPRGSSFIAIRSTLAAFCSKPGGQGDKYIAGKTGATGFFHTLPSAQAMRINIIIATNAAPDPADLHISVWCGDAQFQRVSHRTWKTLTWHNVSSP